MDNPLPSAYAPGDYETFDPDLYETTTEPVTEGADAGDATETEEVENNNEENTISAVEKKTDGIGVE